MKIEVCVPEDFTEEQVIDFAEFLSERKGWSIRSDEDEDCEPERCEESEGFVHITLFTS